MNSVAIASVVVSGVIALASLAGTLWSSAKQRQHDATERQRDRDHELARERKIRLFEKRAEAYAGLLAWMMRQYDEIEGTYPDVRGLGEGLRIEDAEGRRRSWATRREVWSLASAFGSQTVVDLAGDFNGAALAFWGLLVDEIRAIRREPTADRAQTAQAKLTETRADLRKRLVAVAEAIRRDLAT